ncbi:TetR/AcrR family transcriptional regulator [Streptomyces sp. NPDC088116]|uniref:TetR/AcrR family transcriptional regulator n=1 Tax=Streptomyces sp. NPDC088116 TaxID=3365825 RepID=UPI003809B4F0
MTEERRGRPRSTTVHRAILDATRDLLIENGYARLSIDRVAVRAEVGKQTVYRRWPSKAPLVAETVLDGSHAPGPADTGDIHRDLRTWLHGLVAFMTDSRNAALIRALTAAAAEDPHDAEDLYERLTGPQREELVQRLRAGAEAGQVRADADLDAVADALTGALVYQTLAGDGSLSVRRADGLFDVIMRGLRPDVPVTTDRPVVADNHRESHHS